jgi:hypothetical protein
VTLGPNEIADVDIEPLKGAAYGRPEFDHVSIQVLNTGAPGSLIGALNGKDTANRMTYDVPLRDIGGVRNSTGAYPWRLDHGMSTVVSITNVAPMQSEVVVQINYPGGPYLLDPRRLAAGETAVYDLRKIRDRQIPDRNGHTIPRSVAGGQFKWFIHGAGSGRLIGRAEMLGPSERISSSYSCPGGYCPAMFSYAFIVPSDVFFTPGDVAEVNVLEVDCDEFFCIGPFSPNVSGWENSNPFVALLVGNGSSAQLGAISGGTSDFQADIAYDQWAWDGRDCIYGGVNFTNTYGQARVLHIDSISPSRGVVSATTPVTITGTNFASGAAINVAGSGVTVTNTTVNSATSITADFAVAFNATGGNHSVSVTVNGKTSNSKDFYVQIPSKLLPFNHATFAPSGIGPLHTPVNQPLELINGTPFPAPFDHICGVFRHYLFSLADQDNPPQEMALHAG